MFILSYYKCGKFCLLCWKFSCVHRGYSFPHVLFIMLQLKISRNNSCSGAIWSLYNSGSDPLPGTLGTLGIFDIPKLLPSPAWQWPMIYRIVFISQKRPPAQFLMTPELLCTGARLEPAMLTPAWKGGLPSACWVTRDFSTRAWRSSRLTARHLQRLSIHLMAGKEILFLYCFRNNWDKQPPCRTCS